MKPVVIAVGGSVLETWTEMTLARKKSDLTGSLNVTIFGGSMPAAPLVTSLTCGAEITVYIGGQLAFTGTVDSRTGTGSQKGKKGTATHDKKHKGTKGGGKGSKGGKSGGVNIGPNEYTIKISARGKTKRLIDSSHQHPTTNMMQPTTKEVVEKLIEPWGTQLEWKGEVIKLDKVRFRDGMRVVDELHRVALENCYFMYETRDGKLRVTDGVGSESGSGDPLILGYNILTFSAEQSEDKAKSKIKVKGQRTKKNVWGRKALKKTVKEINNRRVKGKSHLTVQAYGDATDKALERRARFEMNKRNTDSKKITIEVFHVQTPSGKPWDIGDTHYVEVPPEGIFDMFECTELTYHVDASKTLKTTLTLSPPPSGSAGGEGGEGGGAGGFGLSSLNMNMGDARRSQAGITLSDSTYPDPWTPPLLSDVPFVPLAEQVASALPPPSQDESKPPPLTLPDWFKERA